MKSLLIISSFFVCVFSWAQNPTANFSISSLKGCVGEPITLTSTSVAGAAAITNYVWSAVGALPESGTGASPTFTTSYSSPGVYSFSLIVQAADGSSDIEQKLDIVVVSAKPVSDISSTVSNCSAPFNVTFGIGTSSTGATMSYTWAFPNGSPSSAIGAVPTSTFATTGTFPVSLTVKDANTGCATVFTKQIVLANYTADFSMNATACKNETVTFTDLSTAGTNKWSWAFPNGTAATSVLQNPTVGFTTIGAKDVVLTATNTTTGCTDIQTKTITILDLPIVTFTQSLDQACAKDSIQFTNTSNTTGATFEWNFGDGSPVFIGNNPPLHDYIINDTFYPKLTMTGPNGCKSTDIDTLILWDPIANFKLDIKDGCAPIQVVFTNLSTSPRPITNFFWDFGDGTTSTIPDPTHIYQCGHFDVQLVIRIQGGCVDTISLTTDDVIDAIGSGLNTLEDNDPTNNFNDSFVRYGQLLDPDFTFDKRVACAQNEVIKLISITPISCPHDQNEVKYNWYFNGILSAIMIDSIYSHQLGDTLLNGPISTRLEIDFNNCISKKDSNDLFWAKAPVALFQPDTSRFCNLGPAHLISFYDTMSVYGHKNSFTFAGYTFPSQAMDDVEVTYDFGDGSPLVTISDDAQLEDQNKGFIQHNYTNYGTYIAKQHIENFTTGCHSDVSLTVLITFMDASILSDTVCVGENIDYNIVTNTFIDHNIIRYTYNLYDTIIYSSSPNLSYQHDSVGVFLEFFEARNFAGCPALISQSFVVFANPIAKISSLNDSVCENSTAQFNPSSSQFGSFTDAWSHFDWTIDGVAQTSNNINTSLTTNPIPLGDSVIITMKATDGFGCVSQIDTFIVFTQKPDAQFTLASILCDNFAGIVDAGPSTGHSPLTYVWTLDGSPLPPTSSETIPYQFAVNPPTKLSEDHTYLLTVLDNKGCMDTISKKVSIRNPQIDSVSIIKKGYSIDEFGGFSCPPVSVDFEIFTSSTDAIVKYQWSLGYDFDNDFDSDNRDPTGIQYSQSGNYDYSVVITDVNGCTTTFTQTQYLFIDGPQAKPIITLDPNDLCGQTYIFEVTNQTNVSAWSWNMDDGTIINSNQFPSDSFSYRFLDNEVFDTQITIYDSLASPVCPVEISLPPIDIPDNGLNANFTANPIDINYGSEVTLHDLSSSIDPIVKWIWTYGDGATDSLSNGNDVTHNYFMLGEIPIELLIIDQNGCTDKARLVIFSTLEFTIPNVITGVGTNGVNSLWTLFADIFIDFKILIVNRWGNVVYEGSRNNLDPRYLWNGIDYKSGKPCVDGTYFWVLEGTLINGKSIKEQGYLTLTGSKSQ